MNTSYFAKSSKHPNAVSIAGKAPFGFKGRIYKELAPKYSFFAQYKIDGDEQAYTKAYNDEVLSKLDPNKVLEELGKDSVILCWEGKDKFCHRHLVASWLIEHLNIEITELD